MFPLANKIGGRVSGNMQLDALKAMFISLLGVVVYLWVRFHKLMYGFAAAVALVHDVLVTVGMLAISKYIVEAVPGLASALQIDSFQISLTIVAALLTIIGYSLNDTIVTFDRLREIKGKSPRLTADDGQRQRQSVLEPDDSHRAHRVHDGRDPVLLRRRRHPRLRLRVPDRRGGRYL